jgi:bifunctional non-homologous end joining protein LigD
MEISNADRVVFPVDGITKGDVAAYYALVGDRLLPFAAGRALTVERFPKGIDGGGFMQKNAPDHYPNDLIARHEVPKEGGGTTVYPVIDSVEAVVYFANQGAITFHVPPVRVDDELHPDWVIWDLDPPPDRVDLVRAAAPRLRELLEEHGITTVVMTSGSKGYHLRTRIARTITVDQAAIVARGTATLAAAGHPDLMTTEFRKADRGDRVFVDWLRNSARSTSVAPWSIRARAGAPVAAPIAWAEIDRIAPDAIGLRTVADRIGLDPWAGLEDADVAQVVGTVERSLDAAGIELEPFDRFRP